MRHNSYVLNAVAFDVDGVLIDSNDTAHDVRKLLFARLNIDLDRVPDPQKEEHRGSSLRGLVSLIRTEYPNVPIDEEYLEAEQTKLVMEELKRNVKGADPALIQFLSELRGHGVKCAVVTSGLSPAVSGKLHLLGIAQYFDVVVTASDVPNPKPSPDPYTRALDSMSVKPENCVVIEDSMAGVIAGNRAGCIVVGFNKYEVEKHPVPRTLFTVSKWEELSFEVLMNRLSVR